jgi:ankyrin repeat protein
MPLTPAHRLIAAAFDSPEATLALLRSAPHLLGARTGLGETPLHYLAVENHLRAVALLVEAGAEVNTLNSCRGTPLSEAASLGYDELVAYLLSHGARLHIPGQEEPALHSAVRGGSVATVRRLLEAGASIDEQNDMRETPLHLAVQSDELLPVVALLIEAGANLNLKRIFDETPLDVALEAGCQGCAAALAAAGAAKGASGAA